MHKLLWISGAVAGSVIGWWLGDKVGVMTAYILSTVGALLGVYAGVKLARNLTE